jgi:chromosome segregation ATPase
MKLQDPVGTAAAVADANELKAQLDAANAEKEVVVGEKATLENTVTALTDENTQLKEELQTVKDALTVAELKVSGKDEELSKVSSDLTAMVGFHKALEGEYDQRANDINAIEATLKATKSELEAATAKIAELTKEVDEVVEIAKVAEAAAAAVKTQNELVASHLAVKGATPEITDGEVIVEDKDAKAAVERYKELQRSVTNARNPMQRHQFNKELIRLSNDPKFSGAIKAYLNSKYTPKDLEVAKVTLSDSDQAEIDHSEDRRRQPDRRVA